MSEEKVQNLKLLIKFLGMTRSSVDAEALVAMRKANEHLDKFKVTWQELLEGKVKITVVPNPFDGLAMPTTTTRAPSFRPDPPMRPPPPKPQPIIMTAEAIRLVSIGRTIEAIREIRIRYGCDLISAKSVVDAYVQANPPRPAGSPPPRSRAKSFDPFTTVDTPAGDTQTTARTNRFAGVCHKCGNRVAAQAGILKGTAGAYKVECAPGKCIKSKYQRSQIDSDDLANLI